MAGTKRVLLLTLVGSLALAAVLGIWVVLFDSFLGLDEEVFGTLGTLFLFALPGLLAASMLERKHWPGVNAAALIVGAVGTLLYLGMIWLDRWQLFDSGPDEWLWKSMLLSTTWAWALPWGAALGLTRFEGAILFARLASIAFVYTFAAMLSVLILFADDWDAEWFLRPLAVVGILTALGTLVTPILHVLFGAARPTPLEFTPLELSIRCPRCLTQQTVAQGKSRCGVCRLRFTIAMEEPRCPKCRYLLHRLTTPRCPECGEALAGEEMATT